MIFGREAKQPCNEWIEKYAQQTNLTEYITDIVQAMANAWRQQTKTSQSLQQDPIQAIGIRRIQGRR